MSALQILTALSLPGHFDEKRRGGWRQTGADDRCFELPGKDVDHGDNHGDGQVKWYGDWP